MKVSLDEPKKINAEPAIGAEPHRTPLQATAAPASPVNGAEIQALFDKLQQKGAKLIRPTGEAQDVPASLGLFLTELLEALGQGKPLAIVPDHAALTTIQASEQLGVSRKFLVGLLEKGDIPFHMVGTHRRIYAKDLYRYKALRDNRRRTAIRELAKAEAAEGIYDDMPPLDDQQG